MVAFAEGLVEPVTSIPWLRPPACHGFFVCHCASVCRSEVSKVLLNQLQHVLFHLFLVDVSNDGERHLLGSEFLLYESYEFVMGDLLDGSYGSEDRPAERVSFEKHLLESVIYILRRGVLV